MLSVVLLAQWPNGVRGVYVTFHMRSHCVTCHPTQVNASHLNLSQYAGTGFSDPGGMEGCVDLGYPAMHRPVVELAISQSQCHDTP